MTDRAALLAAIAAQPHEDTPRLAYADWLDEQPAARATCPRCGGNKFLGAAAPGQHGWIGAPECPTCSGTGTVADDSDARHAELIRVQCALAAPFDASRCESVCAVWCPTCGDCTCPNREERMDSDGCPLHSSYSRHAGDTGLRRREAELLALVEPVVRRGKKCGRCGGWDKLVDHFATHKIKADVVVDCPGCHGGYTGTLARQWTIDERHDAGLLTGTERYYHRCEWSRGFPWRVYCTLDEYRREVGRKTCPMCGARGTVYCGQASYPCRNCWEGVGNLTGRGTVPITWAEALLREHGTVTEIVLTDNPLPSLFTDILVGEDGVYRGGRYVLGAEPLIVIDTDGFNTRNGKIGSPDAASRLLADHTRGLAGLPPVWGGGP